MHRLLSLVVALVLGCSDTLPEPPDTSELELDYTAPTADVSAGDATELGPLIAAVIAVNAAFDRGEVITEGTTEVLTDESGEETELPYDFEGSGVARFTHVCPGWPGMERTAEISGFLQTTVRFDLDGFGAVFWGLAERCAFETEGQNILASTEIIAVRDGDGAIIALDGLVEVAGETLIDEAFDFRAHADGVDYRRELEGRGHVLIRIGLDGLPTVRAANGDFTCDESGCAEVE